MSGLTNETFCCICSGSMKYLWTGSRRGFPDYYCGKCFKDWIIDPDTGEPIADRDLPDWIQTLLRAEKTRRVRQHYWKKRGYELVPVPFSELNVRSKPYLSDAEHLESLGTVVGSGESK